MSTPPLASRESGSVSCAPTERDQRDHAGAEHDQRGAPGEGQREPASVLAGHQLHQHEQHGRIDRGAERERQRLRQCAHPVGLVDRPVCGPVHTARL